MNPVNNSVPDVFAELMNEYKMMYANSAQGRMAEYAKNKVPMVAVTDDYFPELFTALDLPYYLIVRQGLEGAFRLGKGPEAVDGYNGMGGSSSLCSLQKASAYLLATGQLAKPSAVIMSSCTCDGQTAVNELASNYPAWADVPKMCVDAPYLKDEASMEYMGKQWISCIPLLEKIAGHKLDYDRLIQVCEESNKQCQLMFDFQELRRAVPSPIRADWGFFAYMVVKWSSICGLPPATAWVQKLYDATAQRVKNKQGIDGVTEKIRYAWYDILPVWKDKLFPRLEQNFGAVNMMDLYGYNKPWAVIDTSSPETIFTSFAKRFFISNGMSSQVFADSTVYGQDAVNIAKNFKCDAMIMPSHVGHKDGSASHRIVKDMFREIGIPFLVIGCDVFDERYMTPDVVYDKMATFFETAGLTAPQPANNK